MDRPDLVPSEPTSPDNAVEVLDASHLAAYMMTKTSSSLAAGSSDEDKAPEAPAAAASSASGSNDTKRVSFALAVKPTEEQPNGEHWLYAERWPFGPKSDDAEYQELTEQELVRLLPASFRHGPAWIGLAKNRVQQFLTSDLSVDRLLQVFDCFFVLGNGTVSPRTLSYQQALGLDVTAVDSMEMHMLYTKNKMFIKPLARYLMEPKFWYEHLECPDDCVYHDTFTMLRQGAQLHNSRRFTSIRPCSHSILWRRAMGFAFSYVALVSTQSDFDIAKAKALIPDDVTFDDWKHFVARVLSGCGGGRILKLMDKRFTYGELDLARVNQVFMMRSPSEWLANMTVHREMVQSHFLLPPLSVDVAAIFARRFARIAQSKVQEHQYLIILISLPCIWILLCVLSFGRSPSTMLRDGLASRH
ncbi:hypothetical protein ACQKWADRAFT_315597 [Trichoderma austrokoningii]